MLNNYCFRSGLIVLALLGLVGCDDGRLAPVEDRTKLSKHPINQTVPETPATYRVRPGDTLYSIAWRYDLDFKTLAANNNIGRDYVIYPGQVLQLDDRGTGTPVGTSNEVVTVVPLKRPEVTATSRPPKKSPTSSSPSKEIPPNEVVPKEVPPKKAPPKKTPTKEVPPKKAPPQVADKKPPVTRTANSGINLWVWPTQGKLVDKYSNAREGNKGLDISGKYGQNISATAKGRVVYTGNGLRGYGKLIIVKHSEEFLSAYAHNSKILVKENELVEAGQTIAKMGNSDSEKTKLHFEIRYRGKPVNPLIYLPKR